MANGMDNAEIASLFEDIADMLEILGENSFKINAYRRAAENIRSLGRDLSAMVEEGSLDSIEGVGKAISEKITELVKTGRLGYYEELAENVPSGLLDMLEVPDLGPKRVRAIWEKLGIRDLDGLEEAARTGRLKTLDGFGAKTEAKILAGIGALRARKSSGRTPLAVAWDLSRDILEILGSIPKTRVEAGGSLRRMKETIGDLDFLCASRAPEEVLDRFCRMQNVESVLLRGETKTSVRLRTGIQADLRVVEETRWGTAIQYFTGSQQHNVRLRERARKLGFSLSEYALKRISTGEEILCADEEEVYAKLGLPWIPPEMREDRGEIEAALEGRLPPCVELKDIAGDLQCHTDESDGTCALEEMAEAAEELGLFWLLLTDHSSGLGVVRGLSPERIRDQSRRIDHWNASGHGIRLLKGIETEIMADGSLDLPGEVLGELDLVVAAVHSSLRQDREKITRRYLKALADPNVHILAHPVGRLIGEREGASPDWEKVLAEAVRTGTILEINANPYRLDLPDTLASRALELGAFFAISTDAHSTEQLEYMHFGVSLAKRAWIPPERIVNTWDVDKLLEWAKKKPSRLKRLGGTT
ncbi:MAG: polymerase [Synergistales bacterium]|nr:polymerase [Synergistales bacterium]